MRKDGRQRLDDLAGMAGGAFSLISGLRAEMEAMARAQAEAMVRRLELARAEDLEAALEVARRARAHAEALEHRVQALEAQIAVMTAPRQEEPGAEGDLSGGT